MTQTTAAHQPAAKVQNLDPRTLLVDANIRTEMQLGKDFVDSIRDLGVLVPIVAVRTADGESPR
jgi:ParB family transcriptional regulator, chromosome partitioning protein